MAHPRMFDDMDPLLIRVRELAGMFPDSAEKVSHGRPAFFTKKVFVHYGGSFRQEGSWVEHGQSIVFLADPDERPALLADERFYVPAYLGPSGWMGMDLDDGTDWLEVAELVETSFRLTAPKGSVLRLDTSISKDLQ